MSMRDITELMNAYRECSRNLWNVYFSRLEDIGGALDYFGEIRGLLFEALVLDELSSELQADGMAMPALKVVPDRSVILIQRGSGPGEAGYWDQEKDMVVGRADITPAFIDYFDFSQIPIKDFHYYRCRILSFPSRVDYQGRDALLEVGSGTKVFHDDSAGKP